MKRSLLVLIALSLPLIAANPTFLRRSTADVAASQSDLCPSGCKYKALFGQGDPDARQLRGIARYGHITVDPSASSAAVTRSSEEQIVVILDGAGELIYGDQKVPVKRNDFAYVPPAVRHGLANTGSAPLAALIMGFRVPSSDTTPPPDKPQVANIDDVPLQQVGGHPPSTLYRLLLGTTSSTRDRLRCARIVTSLFIMEFAAGGTNIPHNHETEEEIYYVLDGHGQMVAGGGMDGLEGKFPTRAGDAWFFRLNTTVGFYSENKEGEPKARILAVRSLFPFPRR